MVCPVCIIDGFVIISCRFLGIPDVVTAHFIGVLTAFLSIITVSWLKKRVGREDTPKFILLLTVILLSAITLYSMRLIGMW